MKMRDRPPDQILERLKISRKAYFLVFERRGLFDSLTIWKKQCIDLPRSMHGCGSAFKTVLPLFRVSRHKRGNSMAASFVLKRGLKVIGQQQGHMVEMPWLSHSDEGDVIALRLSCGTGKQALIRRFPMGKPARQVILT